MQKYPHIPNKTRYPYIANVDPYAYQITSSPVAWGVQSVIRLLRVPWDASYNNVIDFQDDEHRDKWINEHTGTEYVLETETIMQPDGTCRVPIPANDCMKYNYLAVDFPDQPVEFGSDGLKRICYFVNNAKWLAASTTELQLQLDVWSTYINNTNISYMMLDRGHAPLAAAPSPEEFLSDPLSQTRYVVQDDIVVGGTSRVDMIGEYIATAGDIYAVLAMTADADSSDWGTNQTDTMRIPGGVIPSNTGAANYDYIALPSEDLVSFIMDVMYSLPYFLESIVCCMYISKNDLDLFSDFQILDHTVYRIRPKSGIAKIAELTIDDFGYPDEYKKLTKLYTSQYAQLELVDQDGNARNIKIEDIGAGGTVELYHALNLAGADSRLDAHILNIGSDKQKSITFNLSNLDQKRLTTGGDWASFLLSWSIPQFAIFNDQNNYQSWRRYWTNKQSRYAKDQAYTSSIDSNNVSYGNTIANVESAFLAAGDSAEVSLQNGYNATNTAVRLNTYGNQYQEKQYRNTVEQQMIQTAESMAMGQMDFEAHQQAASLQVSQGFVNGIVGGATSGGAIGAVEGTVNAGVGAIFNAAAITNDAILAQRLVGLQGEAFNKLHGDGVAPTSKTLYDSFYIALNNFDPSKVSTGNGGAAGEGIRNSISYSSDTTLAANTASNVSNQNGYHLTTGGEIQRVSTEGNVETIKTVEGNAVRTRRIGTNNAQASKDLGERNAARTRDTTEAGIVANMQDAELNAPQILGSFANYQHALSRPNAVYANLRTLNDGELSAVGDQMLRYGYTLGQSWKLESKQLMKHFTYWQVSDIWIACCKPSIEPAAETIENIFRRGVTIWSNPDDIGKVSIYDNWRDQ